MRDLGWFEVYVGAIQILSYQRLLSEASNNDLLAELQKQNQEFLEKILRNQIEILKRLERLENAL